jgi:hypothetical protein
VREAKRALDRAQEVIARELASILGYGQTQVFEGAPAFIIRGGNTRKAWDHDGLRRQVTTLIADRLGVTPRAVEEVISAWWEITSPKSAGWKTGGLKQLGLDPDEYCEKTHGPPTIQFEE